jgi:hypothetical protein
MTSDHSIFIAAADVRRALVQPGDIRGEIEFQNDINGLLARIDDGVTLEAGGRSAPAPVAAVQAVRVIKGGVGRARAGAQPPPFRFKMTGTG